MALSKSLLITLLIALLVWMAVWLQPRSEGGLVAAPYNVLPVAARRSASAPAPVSAALTAQKPAVATPSETVAATELIGVSGRVALDSGGMDDLWQRFNQATALQDGLKSDEGIQVFVLYEHFDPQYGSAQATVGYPREVLLNVEAGSGQVPAGQYQVLLRDSRESSALLGAWQRLDFTRLIRAVLERHDLAADGSVRASHVSVLYQ